jgi:hypothetical protein
MGSGIHDAGLHRNASSKSKFVEKERGEMELKALMIYEIP